MPDDDDGQPEARILAHLQETDTRFAAAVFKLAADWCEKEDLAPPVATRTSEGGFVITTVSAEEENASRVNKP